MNLIWILNLMRYGLSCVHGYSLRTCVPDLVFYLIELDRGNVLCAFFCTFGPSGFMMQIQKPFFCSFFHSCLRWFFYFFSFFIFFFFFSLWTLFSTDHTREVTLLSKRNNNANFILLGFHHHSCVCLQKLFKLFFFFHWIFLMNAINGDHYIFPNFCSECIKFLDAYVGTWITI